VQSNQPVTAPADVALLKNAKTLWCSEVLSGADGKFFARSTQGTQVLEVEGSLRVFDDGKLLTKLSFKLNDAAKPLMQAITTTLMLDADKEFAASSMMDTAILVELKTPGAPAPAGVAAK
jgi:hypothetical protein